MSDKKDTTKQTEIGAAQSHLDQRNMQRTTLEAALENIREGADLQGQNIKDLIEVIRSFDAAHDETRRGLKAKLPVLVFAGYSPTNNAEEIQKSPSGLICADVDKLSEDQVATVREKLTSDPHTLACFLSPSGNGFKILHWIPDPESSWSENYRMVEAYYERELGLEIDPSCKNANRLCYLSYDPDIYINWDARRLPVVDLPPSAPAAAVSVEPSVAWEQAEALLEIVPERVGEHVEWIRFCGAVSNYLQSNGNKAEQVLELLCSKWPSAQDRKQLEKLVRDRRDTPFGAAEALARTVCSPEDWSHYRERFPSEWNHRQRYVYDSVSDELVDVESFTARTRKAFDLKYLSDRPVVIGDDGPERVNPSQFTIMRCTEIAGREYAPSERRPVFVHENGERMLNTYRPVVYDRKPEQGEIGRAKKMLTGHIAHMFTDPTEREILMDYLAWCVQNPGKLKPWMVILYGVQGDGKSWFRELMEAALGESNVGVHQSSNLEDKYATPSYGKCLSFIEELKLDNHRKYDTLERLKSLLGNRRVSIREMRKPFREVRATANYLAATNHSDSLPVSDNERRFCVLTSQWVNRKPKLRKWTSENPDYYPALYRLVREEPAAVREALLNHKVSSGFLNTHEAPRTMGTLQMIEEAVTAGAVELQGWIEDWESTWINDQFVILKVLKEKHAEESDPKRYCAGVIPQRMPPTKTLIRYFKELGYIESAKRSLRVNRSEDGEETRENVTVYYKPGVDIDEVFQSYQTGQSIELIRELGA